MVFYEIALARPARRGIERVSARANRGNGLKHGRFVTLNAAPARMRLYGRCVRLVVLLALLATAVPVRAAAPPAAPEQFHHTVWKLEDGAPPDVWVIAQSADGFLWLGTGAGLYRFDGIRFEEVRPSAGRMSDRNITALLAMPNGDLWIGFYSGRIALLSHGRLTSFGSRGGSVHQFVQDGSGTLWAAISRGDHGLARFDGTRWHWLGKRDQTHTGQVFSMVAGPDGSLWISTDAAILRHSPGGRGFTTVTSARRNDRLLATANGEILLLRTSGPVSPVSVPASGFKEIRITLAGRESEIKRARVDRQGAIWWTDENGGVSRLSPTGVAHWSARDGLSANAAVPIFQDREGAVWVGSNLGLDRFRPAILMRADALGAISYGAYVQARLDDGTVYVATPRGMLTRATTDGSLQPLLRLPVSPDLIAADGNRLIVEQGGRLMTPSGSRLVPLALPPLPASINGWSRDAAGTPVIEITDRGIFKLSPGGWQHWRVTGDPGLDRALRLPFSGRAGTWFFAANRLIACSTRGCAPVKTGVDVGRINIIVPATHPGDPVLVGGDNGIAIGSGTRFTSITSDQLPVLAGVTGIAQTPSGGLWINGLRGVVLTTMAAVNDAGHRPLAYRLLTTADGLPGAAQQDANYPTALRGSDGRIWLTASHGIASVDPDRRLRNPLPPPVVIRSVTADGTERRPASELALPAGTRRVQIDYSALSLIDPERVRFRYRLSGVDDGWIDPGRRRQAIYTNLGPGRWVFQVIAANADGVWNRTGATVALTIAPLFYQSWWFRLIVVLLVATLMALLLRARERVRAERTHNLIAAQVAERERIARELHDTLLQGVQGLILRFQAVANILPPGGRAQRLMEAALERGDDVLVESRDKVRALRGAERSRTLPEMLRSIADQVGDGLTVAVVELGDVEAICDPVVDELAAIAREALANIVRHANARKATMSIAFTRRALILTIEDDGRGFDPEVLRSGRLQGHFGLPGMRERAHALSATLSLANRETEGAVVTVSVPRRVAFARSGSFLQRLVHRARRWRARWSS